MSQFKSLLAQTISLLNDRDLKLELVAFRKAFQRLKTRLRNNLMIGRLKQVVTATRRLENDFSVSLLKSYKERIEQNVGKKQKLAYKAIHEFIFKIIKFLDDILDKNIQTYASLQPHYKIGHLIHHLIVVRTSLSRITFCFKALLVYACDLYLEVVLQVDRKLTNEEIIIILKKHDCKPRAEQSIERHESEEQEIEICDTLKVSIEPDEQLQKS